MQIKPIYRAGPMQELKLIFHGAAKTNSECYSRGSVLMFQKVCEGFLATQTLNLGPVFKWTISGNDNIFPLLIVEKKT